MDLIKTDKKQKRVTQSGSGHPKFLFIVLVSFFLEAEEKKLNVADFVSKKVPLKNFGGGTTELFDFQWTLR